jgi:RHS repeat-associated protein
VGKAFYDLAGRTTKTVENYVDGVVSDADDKTVELTYNGNDDQATLAADLTGGGQQVTQNVYGVSTGSDLVSNDLVAAVEYPDPSTGIPSSSSEDTYTYNRLGQVKTKTDRNGTVHTYSYDVVGRVTADAITTLGTGVDGTVRRIEGAYDGQWNLYLITSYDAASGGNIVNQVQRAFNGLGQLIQEWQATTGAVNTSTTPSVQYTYSFDPSGSTNHSRLTGITYPNGRVISYNYATGLDDTISRLTSISDSGTTVESYSYLGLGTVVKRAHPETGVDLTYVKLSGESTGDAGDQYTGLDRFGRVDDQRWTTSAGTAADRRQYGYDRDSNRLYADNQVSTSNSELYAYDGLNQLTSFQRGTLNGTKTGLTGSASRSQSWDFDAVGNFDSQTTDGTTQTRSANKQNEITSISGATTPTYDAAGDMTGDETGKQFVYDAWGRLVAVKDSGGSTLAAYRYDGLGRRAQETVSGTTTDLYYSDQWQVLEERVGGVAKASYVWSPVYVDALICRDRDTDGNGTLDERLYAPQDVNWNVVALVNTSGTVVERYAYDAYGTQTVMDGGWNTRTGSSYAFPLGFQGLRYDAAASGYNARNREEDPALGQFTATDPLGFGAGDADLYRYERNGPEGTADPSGLQGFGGGWARPPGTPLPPPAPPGPGNSGHVPPLDLSWGGPKASNPFMRPAGTPDLPMFPSPKPWTPSWRLPDSPPPEPDAFVADHRSDEEFAKACRLSAIDERLRSGMCNPNEEILLLAEARSLEGSWLDGALVIGPAILMDIGSGRAGGRGAGAAARRGGGRGAFNLAKRDCGIPQAQHPDFVRRVPMTDMFQRAVRGPDGRPIRTREYIYTLPDGTKVIIQDHSAGHPEYGIGPHLNVRPIEDPRHGVVPGTQPHYPFGGS